MLVYFSYTYTCLTSENSKDYENNRQKCGYLSAKIDTNNEYVRVCR